MKHAVYNYCQLRSAIITHSWLCITPSKATTLWQRHSSRIHYPLLATFQIESLCRIWETQRTNQFARGVVIFIWLEATISHPPSKIEAHEKKMHIIYMLRASLNRIDNIRHPTYGKICWVYWCAQKLVIVKLRSSGQSGAMVTHLVLRYLVTDVRHPDLIWLRSSHCIIQWEFTWWNDGCCSKSFKSID